MNIVKAFFLVTFFLCSFGYADLEDHLQKAENKSDIHKMRNIDFIYMINLDHRTEKFVQSSELLHSYGIYPYRFSAVNGWNLSLEDINDIGLKYQPGMTPLLATTYPMEPEAEGQPSHEWMTEVGKTYFCHCMPRGAMGCSLSHISILKDAWESGYETIWVMEDDIEIIKDPNILSDLIDRLDATVGRDNWDVLLTDVDYRTTNGYLRASGATKRPDMNCSIQERYSEKYTTNKQISPDFKKVSARFATHSMIIRRSGIKKLLEFAKAHQIFLPYDLDNYLAPGLKRYSPTYDVVTNLLGSFSDIGMNLQVKK